MTKRILIVSAIVIILVLSACGDNNNTQQDHKSADITTQNEPEQLITNDGQVLYDQNDIKLTYYGFKGEGPWGPRFAFSFENNSNINYGMSIESISLNGIDIDAMFGHIVMAGDCDDISLDLMKYSLYNYNITVLENFEMTIRFNKVGDITDAIYLDFEINGPLDLYEK